MSEKLNILDQNVNEEEIRFINTENAWSGEDSILCHNTYFIPGTHRGLYDEDTQNTIINGISYKN